MVIMSLSCTVSEMANTGRKSPFEPTPSLFGAPVGVITLEFRRDFWHQKTGVPTRRCLRDPAFSRFGTVPACDGQTDRQTHDNSIYRATRDRML